MLPGDRATPIPTTFRTAPEASQFKTKLGGATAWTKRNKPGGKFMTVKKPAKKKMLPKKS
jgi:hypothetical protein